MNPKTPIFLSRLDDPLTIQIRRRIPQVHSERRTQRVQCFRIRVRVHGRASDAVLCRGSAHASDRSWLVSQKTKKIPIFFSSGTVFQNKRTHKAISPRLAMRMDVNGLVTLDRYLRRNMDGGERLGCRIAGLLSIILRVGGCMCFMMRLGSLDVFL